jgi:nucleotide-binding universal stress UspA family protein
MHHHSRITGNPGSYQKSARNSCYFTSSTSSTLAEIRCQVPEIYIREGSPRPVLVDSASEFDCQMIIAGTHGRSGLMHLLLGSVAEYVIRHSSVPVLTIRPRE